MTGSSIVTFLPPRIGQFWYDTGSPGDGGRYISARKQVVILSKKEEADGKQVKDLFVGRQAKATQVFAPADEHCNVHPYCLHLWCCLDGDPLPDFRGPGGVI